MQSDQAAHMASKNPGAQDQVIGDRSQQRERNEKQNLNELLVRFMIGWGQNTITATINIRNKKQGAIFT